MEGLGSYRRRLDIIADILLVVSVRPKKTQIMYQANLSYHLLTKYLADIRRACLVSFKRNERCYELTSKGKEFLELYKEYSRRNKYAEKHLSDVNSKRKVLETLCASR